MLDKSLKGNQFAIFNHAFPKEQIFSLQMRELPDFSFSATAPKTMASVRYPEIEMQVPVNKNLIDFYNSYPVSDYWNWYAGASLSENVKQTVYPVL
ncbi:MAG: hypothetical protein LBV39_06410, partial [Bacteroidales bacterium]|nr:hypothetical protein [Bacteroidales bacterium]